MGANSTRTNRLACLTVCATDAHTDCLKDFTRITFKKEGNEEEEAEQEGKEEILHDSNRLVDLVKSQGEKYGLKPRNRNE